VPPTAHPLKIGGGCTFCTIRRQFFLHDAPYLTHSDAKMKDLKYRAVRRSLVRERIVLRSKVPLTGGGFRGWVTHLSLSATKKGVIEITPFL